MYRELAFTALHVLSLQATYGNHWVEGATVYPSRSIEEGNQLWESKVKAVLMLHHSWLQVCLGGSYVYLFYMCRFTCAEPKSRVTLVCTQGMWMVWLIVNDLLCISCMTACWCFCSEAVKETQSCDGYWRFSDGWYSAKVCKCHWYTLQMSLASLLLQYPKCYFGTPFFPECVPITWLERCSLRLILYSCHTIISWISRYMFTWNLLWWKLQITQSYIYMAQLCFNESACSLILTDKKDAQYQCTGNHHYSGWGP